MDTPTTTTAVESIKDDAPLFPMAFTAAAFRRRREGRVNTLAHSIAGKCEAALEKALDSRQVLVHLFDNSDAISLQQDQTQAGAIVIASLKSRGFTASVEKVDSGSTYINITY